MTYYRLFYWSNLAFLKVWSDLKVYLKAYFLLMLSNRPFYVFLSRQHEFFMLFNLFFLKYAYISRSIRFHMIFLIVET